MIIVLLGPPGSGKGTQAKKLWTERKLPHLSTGDMLRAAIQSGSRLGMQAKSFMDQGSLVPDEVVVGLIGERTEHSDCRGGFVLDGFPRTIPQAQALDLMLAKRSQQVDRVVLFDIPDDDLVIRLSGRRTCIKCGALYHSVGSPPRKEGVCDQCGSSLIQRDDDHIEVIKKRLSVYHQQTKPLVDFYMKQGKLKQLDARKSTQEVSRALAEALQ